MKDVIVPSALYISVPKSMDEDCFYIKRQSKIHSGKDILAMINHTTKEGDFYFFEIYNIYYIGPEVKIVKSISDGKVKFELEDYNVGQS